jgi:hypothetical protein
MNELRLPQEADSPSGPPSNTSFLRRQLPYIIVLVLAISGVAYTNISHESLVGFWEFLTLAMGVACVATQWAQADDSQARFQLILKQALHWGATLVAMNIMLLSGVRRSCLRRQPVSCF